MKSVSKGLIQSLCPVEYGAMEASVADIGGTGLYLYDRISEAIDRVSFGRKVSDGKVSRLADALRALQDALRGKGVPVMLGVDETRLGSAEVLFLLDEGELYCLSDSGKRILGVLGGSEGDLGDTRHTMYYTGK